MSALSLYWTSTADHHEDDFVVASSAKEASDFHEGYVGYNPGDAKSQRLSAVEESHDAPAYADHELLRRLGFKMLTKNDAVVFAKHGRIFKPMDIRYRLFLSEARDRKGMYVIEAVGTARYKIGQTSNLAHRLTGLQTGSPNLLRARIFVECKRPKDLEKAVHEWLKEKREGREWFVLENDEYRDFRAMIWGLTRLSPEYRIADFDCYPQLP